MTLVQTPGWDAFLELFWTSFGTDMGRQGHHKIHLKIGRKDDRSNGKKGEKYALISSAWNKYWHRDLPELPVQI